MRYLVVGASGFAQEVAWTLHARARAEEQLIEFLFFDDRLPSGPLASGLGAIVGDLDAIADYVVPGTTELVLGIGTPRAKSAVTARLSGLGLPWTTVVHPSATIGLNIRIGAGSYVGAGTICTVNARIGRFTTINLHCVVAHDDALEDFVTLHPDVHLSGDVRVGEGAELGAGAIVIPGVRIGAWAVLGAGCVAVRSLAGQQTYVGIPAREAHAAATRTPEHLVAAAPLAAPAQATPGAPNVSRRNACPSQ
jgi:sugar O-acyltransferase (sialic acid O-acetyltransferase NeuD family)